MPCPPKSFWKFEAVENMYYIYIIYSTVSFSATQGWGGCAGMGGGNRTTSQEGRNVNHAPPAVHERPRSPPQTPCTNTQPGKTKRLTIEYNSISSPGPIRCQNAAISKTYAPIGKTYSRRTRACRMATLYICSITL